MNNRQAICGSAHPFEIKGKVQQVLVRLRCAATSRSFCHDSGDLGGGK